MAYNYRVDCYNFAHSISKKFPKHQQKANVFSLVFAVPKMDRVSLLIPYYIYGIIAWESMFNVMNFCMQSTHGNNIHLIKRFTVINYCCLYNGCTLSWLQERTICKLNCLRDWCIDSGTGNMIPCVWRFPSTPKIFTLS